MESVFDDGCDRGYDQQWDDRPSHYYRSRSDDIIDELSGDDDTYESDLNVLDILNTLRVVGSAHPLGSSALTVPHGAEEYFPRISSERRDCVVQPRTRREQQQHQPLVKPRRLAPGHDEGGRPVASVRLNAHAQSHVKGYQQTPEPHLSTGADAPQRARPSRLPGSPMPRSHVAAPCSTPPMRRSLAKQQALVKVGEREGK